MIKNRISTKDNPLRFFDYFLKEGFIKYHNTFFGISESYNADLFIKTKKNKIKSFTPGVWSITEEEKMAGSNGTFIYFNDELNSLLIEQVEITMNFINEAILNFNQEHGKHYISMLTLRINNFKREYEKLSVLSIYINIDKYFDSIIDKLKDYSNIENSSLNESVPKTFKMKDEYYAKIETLYNMLIKKEYLSKRTSLFAFQNAFNGNAIPQKPTLRWLKLAKNKQEISKPFLIKFIQFLIGYKVIESVTEKHLKFLIPSIFLNHKGKMIKNIQESFSGMSSRARETKDEKELSSTISQFAKLK